MGMFRLKVVQAAVVGVLAALTACSHTETGTALPSESGAHAPNPSAAAPTSPTVLTPAELCSALHQHAPAAFSRILGIDPITVSPFGPGALCRFSGQRPTDLYPTVGAATVILPTTDTVEGLTARNRQSMAAKVRDMRITPAAGLPGAQVLSGVDDLGVMRGFGVVAVPGGLLEITLSGPKVTADMIGRILAIVDDLATR